MPSIDLKVPEGRNNLWGKTKAAFKYIHEHHLDDADWFLKADDDTYVVVDNLRSFVADRDPADPVYFGFNFKVNVRQGYMSGGAGYVLSKEAVRRFVLKGLGSRHGACEFVSVSPSKGGKNFFLHENQVLRKDAWKLEVSQFLRNRNSRFPFLGESDH